MTGMASAGTARTRQALAYGAIALAVCVLMALRSAGTELVGRSLARQFTLTKADEQIAWIVLYYLMWAALTPLVFATVRRHPFRRGGWIGPLMFHVPVSVAVSTTAPVLLAILFGGLVIHRGWPEPGDLLTPFWTRFAAVRAITDTLMYWILLGAGHAVQRYDDYQVMRLRAAELERSLAAAQVDSLKMKLQPHFLFNTLNSISFLAIERDTGTLVTMVERLGSLLRASMSSNGRHLIPLDEELTLLDQYLSIEELRFKDRFRVVQRIDAAARGARVPSLLLQPIVENSIKHGLSRRLDASRLEIAIDRDGDSLLVVVTDDGPGLPPGWDMATHCGRGLRNVIERLDALYRGAWSFSLKNAPGRGAVAELRIPYGA